MRFLTVAMLIQAVTVFFVLQKLYPTFPRERRRKNWGHKSIPSLLILFHLLTVYRAFSSGLGPGKRSAGSKVGTWLTRKRRALSCCAACTRSPAGPSMQNVYLATEETPGDLLANYRSGHGQR